MIMNRYVSIACDRWPAPDICNGTIDTHSTTVARARKEARSAGWRYLGGEDLCPRHAPNRTIGLEGR